MPGIFYRGTGRGEKSIARQGFFGKALDAIGRFFSGLAGGGEQPPEEEVYEEEVVEETTYYGYEPPEPAYSPPEAPYYYPESDVEFNPQEDINTFDYIADRLGIVGDEYKERILYAGWFDMDQDPDTRRSARLELYRVLGIGSEEFYWDQWRDWYTGETG